MKKGFLASLTICIAITVSAGEIYAQKSDSDFTYKLQPLINSNQFETNSRKSFAEGSHFNEISTKAIRHFLNTFTQAEDVYWYKAGTGVVAYFTLNNIKTKAAYDKKGHWLYSVRTYEESYLPKDIREKIKCTFYDFTITSVNEVTTDREFSYKVLIENDSSLKVIQLFDDEITIVKEFVKAIKNPR